MRKILLVLSLLSVLLLTQPVAADNGNGRGSSPRIKVREGASSNWGGYAVATNLLNPQSNAVSDVRGTWTIPTLNCTNLTHTTYSSAWVGIDGYSSNTVEQTGTEHDCVNGQARYSVWYEMYPKWPVTISMPIQAGDIFTARVQYIGNNLFTLTISNTTQNKTFTTTLRAKAKRQSAEWVVEAPYSGGVLPLANFGQMSFTNATAVLNGVSGTISSFANDPITMVGNSFTKATPSALISDGSGFSMTWNHE